MDWLIKLLGGYTKKEYADMFYQQSEIIEMQREMNASYKRYNELTDNQVECFCGTTTEILNILKEVVFKVERREHIESGKKRG